MFSYLGGKKFQAKWIASQFPKHNTYVEPFGGAYWVYFMANHQIDQAHTNVYNDFNRDIANIFHCARYDDRKFLKSLLSYEDQNKELFNQFKKDLFPLTTDFELGDVDRATKYLYLQTQSFSGDTLTEKTKYVDLRGKYKSKYQHFIDKISNKKWLYHIKGINHVHNESFETVIDMYDKPDTLFYCDPPYYKMENYYVQDFNRSQHEDLANKLKSIKGNFVLSYYDFPLLSEWFPKDKYHWVSKEFSKQNASKNKGSGKGKEILIMNFKPALTLE